MKFGMNVMPLKEIPVTQFSVSYNR